MLYEYQPTRKAEHAEAFLKGFSGWLHADGYQGYHKLPEHIRAAAIYCGILYGTTHQVRRNQRYVCVI